MLPKKYRLKSSREFGTTYNLKRSVANSLLILYVGREKKDPAILTKVGFVVGKKVHKRATKRNRIKRLIRETYRSLGSTENAYTNNWETLIFLARPASLGADYNQIKDAVEDCFKKAAKKFLS